MYEKLIQKIESGKVSNKKPLTVNIPEVRNKTVKVQEPPSNATAVVVEEVKPVSVSQNSTTLVDKAKKITYQFNYLFSGPFKINKEKQTIQSSHRDC